MSTGKRKRQARFIEAARADIGRLAADDPRLASVALRMVRDLEAGVVDGAPLSAMAATGDLRDCRKLYFGHGNPTSHRIVYRVDEADRSVEILEVVAVEERSELYVYLLAAQRLGRLPVESKRRFNRLHQQAILRRSSRGRGR